METERLERPTVPEGVRAAKDLRDGEPRAFGVELEGYAHLPRMLDKARATLAGTAGRYQFGCPVDHTCMARLDVTPELVLELAARHADDRCVLHALRDHGIPSAEEAWFDAALVEDQLQQDGVYLRVRSREQLPDQGDGRLFAGADHGAEVDVVLVEMASGQSRPTTVATEAHVWVMQEGKAKFFLGSAQARIARAGELVRIPAHVMWRLESMGPGPLRAITVKPATRG